MIGDKCIYCGTTLHFNSDRPAHIDCEEKALYQQRLDKVLAKFINNGVYHYYVIHDNLDICYYKNNFSMLGNKESFGSPYEINISLDTVEHLIKDMEARDE